MAALKIIFSIFLGLMLAVFLGIGVYTFYPPPAEEVDYGNMEQPRLEDRTARDTATVATDDDDLAVAGRATPDKPDLEAKNASVYDGAERARARDAWRQRTSILLIILATLSMAVSLIRPDRLPVVSSGLLLGGVFTMIYGVGWTVSTGLSTGRFAVVTVAFVITLVLGWLRFAAASTVADHGDGRASDLEERVRALEARLDQKAVEQVERASNEGFARRR